LPEYSIKHECNPAGEKSLDKATWVGFAEQFCNDNNGKTLVKRVDGKFDGAIENYYEKDDTKAHIYSFMDDDCYFPEIEEESKINAEECIYGIKWLFDQCKF
jgi:hypothetical protein